MDYVLKIPFIGDRTGPNQLTKLVDSLVPCLKQSGYYINDLTRLISAQAKRINIIAAAYTEEVHTPVQINTF